MGEWGQLLAEARDMLVAAFWLFPPEENEWRLMFASPEVGAKGPLSVYGKIRLALNELGSEAAAVRLAMIGLLDEQEDLVRRLKSTLHTGPGISRIRFSRNVANGRYIEDALIYRAA